MSLLPFVFHAHFTYVGRPKNKTHTHTHTHKHKRRKNREKHLLFQYILNRLGKNNSSEIKSYICIAPK